MVGRRSFLGFFAGGIAAGPKKIASLTGISLDPLWNGALPLKGDGLVPMTPIPITATAKKAAGYYEQKALKQLNILKFFMPEWYVDKRRDEAKEVHTFDLDLASMKSVSMAGKVAIQRERNFNRQLQMEEDRYNKRLKEKLWMKLNGAPDDDDDGDRTW